MVINVYSAFLSQSKERFDLHCWSTESEWITVWILQVRILTAWDISSQEQEDDSGICAFRTESCSRHITCLFSKGHKSKWCNKWKSSSWAQGWKCAAWIHLIAVITLLYFLLSQCSHAAGSFQSHQQFHVKVVEASGFPFLFFREMPKSKAGYLLQNLALLF